MVMRLDRGAPLDSIKLQPVVMCWQRQQKVLRRSRLRYPYPSEQRVRLAIGVNVKDLCQY